MHVEPLQTSGSKPSVGRHSSPSPSCCSSHSRSAWSCSAALLGVARVAEKQQTFDGSRRPNPWPTERMIAIINEGMKAQCPGWSFGRCDHHVRRGARRSPTTRREQTANRWARPARRKSEGPTLGFTSRGRLSLDSRVPAGSHSTRDPVGPDRALPGHLTRVLAMAPRSMGRSLPCPSVNSSSVRESWSNVSSRQRSRHRKHADRSHARYQHT
jgi:hypothetical protein